CQRVDLCPLPAQRESARKGIAANTFVSEIRFAIREYSLGWCPTSSTVLHATVGIPFFLKRFPTVWPPIPTNFGSLFVMREIAFPKSLAVSLVGEVAGPASSRWMISRDTSAPYSDLKSRSCASMSDRTESTEYSGRTRQSK